MWQAVHDRPPTSINLNKRGVFIPLTCQFCLTAPESLPHILYECEYAKDFWLFSQAKHLPKQSSVSLMYHWSNILLTEGLAALS